MAKRTKKVGSVGRFQARYGVRAKTMVKNIEIIEKAKHDCPKCGNKKVKRIGTSIWQCKKCGVKFAGGAYQPRTEPGQNIEKIIRGEITPEILKEREEEKGDKKL
ncbi:MAG: 50S ribosomal protein L37Ae [Candidatus Thermoplasmatota archaeon]|nr:50S ribosomal protein L37Ae [Candidatus Thermoplasmatota archaeon]